MSTQTVEERLRKATNSVAQILALLAADSDTLGLQDDDLKDAAHEAALTAHAELSCLRGLPAAVLNTGAPDGGPRR